MNQSEADIQEKIVKFLKVRDWYVVIVHGNMHTFGMPDLFCCHSKYGIRLVEIKKRENYSFTGAQLEKFPKLCANGAGVWILCDATEEEYQKLFKAPNWWHYLKW